MTRHAKSLVDFLVFGAQDEKVSSAVAVVSVRQASPLGSAVDLPLDSGSRFPSSKRTGTSAYDCDDAQRRPDRPSPSLGVALPVARVLFLCGGTWNLPWVFPVLLAVSCVVKRTAFTDHGANGITALQRAGAAGVEAPPGHQPCPVHHGHHQEQGGGRRQRGPDAVSCFSGGLPPSEGYSPLLSPPPAHLPHVCL